ncbi:MAG: hypothetical protein JWQ08_1666, partial [Deinococcus sp.]|nr:hypothetical protein [Deinococcus sp.]
MTLRRVNRLSRGADQLGRRVLVRSHQKMTNG